MYKKDDGGRLRSQKDSLMFGKKNNNINVDNLTNYHNIFEIRVLSNHGSF